MVETNSSALLNRNILLDGNVGHLSVDFLIWDGPDFSNYTLRKVGMPPSFLFHPRYGQTILESKIAFFTV
ncbi:MAG: hypothetical protein JW779_05380 [Candidatus Thorarchaeota archaeon]|nr:hypothetical protein [Candidatus Thorarchaeota archaeon]